LHELAIAQRLIETAVTLLPNGNEHIAALHVQLGALAGVSKDELLFGFVAMSDGTPCAGALLEVTEMPAVVHCPHCGVDFAVAETEYLLCPTCGTPAILVMQGKELLITSIEVSSTEVYEEALHG
jgi:hydrogenase nickel incorporation protein HypA/HybF